MKDTPEFPPLTERDRSLIVNALMVVGGQFGATKIERRGLWTECYNDMTKKLGYPGPGWGVKDDRPTCAHGCTPAFLDGKRASSCWECEGEAYREKLDAALRRANDAEGELNETWFDEAHGPDAWRRPTAEAYARVCVLYRKANQELENLRRPVEEGAEVDARAILDGEDRDPVRDFGAAVIFERLLGKARAQKDESKRLAEKAGDMMRAAEARTAELEAQLNAPELQDFVAGAVREAAHQRRRWPEGHDAGKTPEDWLWLVAHLATKAVSAYRYGDRAKYVHHIVTTAAACANWHAHETGEVTPSAPKCCEGWGNGHWLNAANECHALTSQPGDRWVSLDEKFEDQRKKPTPLPIDPDLNKDQS